MKTQKVLLIDDEYVTLAILEDLLTAHGYQVITANRADAGIREAIYGNPDLIMLDIILPDQDGFAVLSELRKNERTRGIPVVFMSALAQSQAFETRDAAAFVSKPITAAEVLPVLARILNQR